MAYKYKAYTIDKKVVEGMIEAVSESAAESALYQAGYQHILSLRETHRTEASLDSLIPSIFGTKTQDIIDFLRQLATLLEAGISIDTALQLLEGQTPKATFRKVINGLVEEIQNGNSLSHGLGKYPQLFSRTHFQVIKASEQSGNLEAGLRQVADYLEKRTGNMQRITRAMIYPVTVLIIAIGVVILLTTVALPPLVRLFTSMDAELPWMTKLLLSFSGFLINYKFHILGGIFMAVIMAAGYVRLPSGKLAVDRLMLKLPVFGPINIENNLSHFCHMASMLLKSGVRLPEIMDLAADTSGNSVIRQALRNVGDRLVQGQGLSLPMSDNPIFPSLMVEMVAVGERTGALDASLDTVANLYDRRVSQRMDIMTSMMEPIMTVAIGAVVIFIALSMITPLYSILRSM
ncbi:type II secretion system F family protein [Chloroflexota bacterium]